MSTRSAHADQSLAPAIEWLRLLLQAYLASDRTSFAVSAAPPAPTVLPLQRLSRQMGLSVFEEQILLLCAAAELDPEIGELYAQAQGNPNAFYPTFALALALFADVSWAALSADSPLRYWRLIEIDHSLQRPLTLCPLRVDERIINFLQGLNQLDHRLRPFLLPMSFAQEEIRTRSVEPIALPSSQQIHVNQALSRLQEADGGERWPILQLVGPDSMSKRLVTQQIATRLGVQIYTLPTQLLPPQTKDMEDFARLWHRESLLLPLALYLDTTELDPDGANGNTLFLVQQFLARSDGLFLLDTREIWSNLHLPHAILDIGKPTPVEQIAAWESLLPSGSADLISHLTAQFNLNLPTIRQIGLATQAEYVPQAQDKVADNGAHPLSPLSERLWQACLAYTRPHLDQLAQRITPKATWDDIVLPEEQLRLLHHIADQVSQRSTVYNRWGFRQRSSRGLGITVLFAGESGTGKTMSAEILANHLQLNLYRIDLSAVVSKYIGETEKNLRKLFDAAEDGGALLFFDEADSLFGKRSEVKDSHDRYANIETNYLLQRLEAYQGLAILATNMKSGLDDAFTRRLRFTIVFSKLDESHRRQIWQKAFPPETPVQGLDYEHLARGWKLSGGSIYNIALNAAFMAAKAGCPVGMSQVLTAIRIELSKEDRLLNESDFVWNKEPR